MTLRNFSLNSPEAYEALCEPVDRPWIPNGALPQEPRWPRKVAAVPVMAENEADAGEAFKQWLTHVEVGRMLALSEPGDPGDKAE